jgi:hypothetical protein
LHEVRIVKPLETLADVRFDGARRVEQLVAVPKIATRRWARCDETVHFSLELTRELPCADFFEPLKTHAAFLSKLYAQV